jgi:hypothetical protein
MIGVSAATNAGKMMLVSGLSGLVAGACSMAIGEFVSVYAQYDIEVSQARWPDAEECVGASSVTSTAAFGFCSARCRCEEYEYCLFELVDGRVCIGARNTNTSSVTTALHWSSVSVFRLSTRLYIYSVAS